MVVTILTRTWHSVRNTGRMPRSNTGNFTQTTMSLPGKPGNSPSGGDTLKSVTFRNSKDIYHFILGKNGVDGDFLFEKSAATSAHVLRELLFLVVAHLGLHLLQDGLCVADDLVLEERAN